MRMKMGNGKEKGDCERCCNKENHQPASKKPIGKHYLKKNKKAVKAVKSQRTHQQESARKSSLGVHPKIDVNTLIRHNLQLSAG